MKHLLLTTIAAGALVGCGPSVPDISIHEAARDGNIEAVKQHLAAGTDVNAKDEISGQAVHGATPLHYAAARGRNKIVELLIVKGADVNTKTEFGETPLHYAATKDEQEVIEQRIAKGADINAKAGKGKNQGTTPLDYAIMWEHTAIADLLRKHGGKSGTEDSIHVAAALGNIEAIKQHLAVGADVNARKAHGGTTPLHRAASRGHKEVAELLIANGADVNQVAEMKRVDVSGNTTVKTTPLDFAKRHPETADLLRKHGGKTAKELEAEGK